MSKHTPKSAGDQPTSTAAKVVPITEAVDALWPTKLQRDRYGQIKPLLINTLQFLEHHDRWAARFRFNQLTNKEEITWDAYDPFEPVADLHIGRLQAWFEENYKLSIATDVMQKAVHLKTRENPYHPLLLKLDSLVWDKVPRVETFAPVYLGTEDNEYTRYVGRLMLNMAVRRLYEPGCKTDYMPILVGDQGIGKSTAIKIMAYGEPGYGDLSLSVERDQHWKEIIHTHWINEISELASFNRADLAKIKQTLSCDTDDHFRKYGHFPVNWPRRFIFIGTTNDPECLSDLTGNRRFCPLDCKKANLSKLKADIDQIWAEAVHRYKDLKEHLSLPPPLAAEHQESHREIDVWEEVLVEHFQAHGGKPKSILNKDLRAILATTLGKQSYWGGKRLGQVMRKLGYLPNGDTNARGWNLSA